MSPSTHIIGSFVVVLLISTLLDVCQCKSVTGSFTDFTGDVISTKAQNRYFMDDDNDQGLTALPIDLCFESESYPSSKYMKYECSEDGQSVIKTKYSDAQCTNPTSVKVYNESHATSPCGLYNFQCEGYDQYLMTGAFYKYTSKDKNCNSLESRLPTVLGCFCSSETTSFQL